MHLLATEPGMIADGSAAVDLCQTAGDIVVLASADTEIALLAAAQASRRWNDPAAPTLRLAPVMRLGHNFSVDVYMETVAQARLVIARLLGGSRYWPGRALPSVDEISQEWQGDGGVVPIVFYRALVQSGNTMPVDALVQALMMRRLQPLPIFVHSLKDAEAAALLINLFAGHPPAV